MALDLSPLDVSKYLTDPHDQAELVAEAFATGDGVVIRGALAIVARARGMTRVARDAGMTREDLHAALAAEEDPGFGTILGIIGALGIRLSADTAAVDA